MKLCLPARWVATGTNLGYGRAANRGAATPEAQAARYLLVCNPDVELGEGAVRALEASLDDDPSRPEDGSLQVIVGGGK